jgi:hypothetical protein
MSYETDSGQVNPQCSAVGCRLSGYADGICSPEDAVAVERHIATCRECSADLAFLRASSSVLRSAQSIEPPPGLRDSIFAATMLHPSAASRMQRLFARMLTPAPVRALAFTAVACAIALGIMRPSDTARNPEAFGVSNTRIAAVTAEAAQTYSGVVKAPVRSHGDAPVVFQRGAPSRSYRASNALLVSDIVRPRVARQATTVPHRLVAARRVVEPEGMGVTPTGEDASERPIDNTAVAMSESNSTPSEPETPVSPAPVAVTTASASRNESLRTTMVSSVNPGPGQITTLADLRRSLRQQASSGGRELASAVVPRPQIRLDVIHGSF